MIKKKDSEEALKTNIVGEILYLMYPTELESRKAQPSPTTADYKKKARNDKRLAGAACPTMPINKLSSFDAHLMSEQKRLVKDYTVEELYKIRDEKEYDKKVRDEKEKLIAEAEAKVKADSADNNKQQTTIKAEKECQQWLEGLMENNSPQPKIKKLYQDEAKQKYGVGVNAFIRAWANAKTAKNNTNWGKPGKKKS